MLYCKFLYPLPLSFFFFHRYPSIAKWVFSYLLNTSANVAAFKTRFNTPHDVDIAYYPKGATQIVFFPLMAIVEGGVSFLVDHLLLKTLSFYSLNLDQCLPNFYRVVSCVGCLNQLYGVNLTHHDNDFLYSIWGSLKIKYYLQTWNTMVRLISCLLDSNRLVFSIPRLSKIL